MPFIANDLSAVAQGGDGFTLWHYHSADSRAAVTAAGYFPAAALMKAGDLLLLQSADAMALLPVRSGLRFGPGSTLDGAIGGLLASRSLALQFSLAQSAAAGFRSLGLGAPPSGIIAGASFSIAATTIGGLAQLDFTLLNAAGAALGAPVRATVTANAASASFTAPAAGSGYRIRAVAVEDSTLTALSSSFVIGADIQLLLLQAGGALLTQGGARLQA